MLRGFIRLLTLTILSFFCTSLLSVKGTAYSKENYTSKVLDTTIINVLFREGDSLFNINIQKAAAAYREALALSRKNVYQRGIADGYYRLGTVYEKNLDIKEAIRALNIARKYYEKLGINENLPDCHGRIGLLYVKLGQPQKGLEELIRGLSLAEKSNNTPSRIRLYILLAMHHNDYTGDYDKALECLKRAEQLNNSKTPQGKALLGHIYLQYGISYRNKKNFKKSLCYNSGSIKIRRSLNDSNNLARSYLDRVSTYYGMKDAEGILRSVKLSSASLQNKMDKQAVANIESSYAQAYYLQKKYNQALYKAKSAASIMLESKQHQSLQELRPLLFKLLYINKKTEEADSVYNAYTKEKDRLYSRIAVLSDTEMRNKYEADKKDRQIRLQELELSHHKFQTYSLEAVLVLLLITSSVFYLRFLDRKKNNSLLAQKNMEIEKQVEMLHLANEQKEMLIREVHHRVKNNLQIISSLFNLQARHLAHPDIAKVLNECKSRLKSIALIHDQLYSEDRLSKIDLQPYTEQLLRYLLDIYHTKGSDISADISTGNVVLNADTAVPLGLILTELITNSLKHAFSDSLENRITIRISKIDQNEYSLSYRDSGPGLKGGQIGNMNESLGFRLIISLSRQLSGYFSYQHDPDQTFHINFKETNDSSVKHPYS